MSKGEYAGNKRGGTQHLRKGYITRVCEKDKTLYSSTRAAKKFVELFSRLYLELYEDSPEFKI